MLITITNKSCCQIALTSHTKCFFLRVCVFLTVCLNSSLGSLGNKSQTIWPPCHNAKALVSRFSSAEKESLIIMWDAWLAPSADWQVAYSPRPILRGEECGSSLTASTSTAHALFLWAWKEPCEYSCQRLTASSVKLGAISPAKNTLPSIVRLFFSPLHNYFHNSSQSDE